MVLFRGIAQGLKAMHQYHVRGAPGGADSLRNAGRVRQAAAAADRDASKKAARSAKGKGRAQPNGAAETMSAVPPSEDPDEENEPLMESEVTASQADHAPGDLRAYAHRDIKPGNIMIDDDGTTPVLMDLGSLAPAPTPITSRALALAVQEQAEEHSTMPYRAPELFDVKTDCTIDTQVDIWSVGCTLYACLVGKSPFEARSEETGGSLNICVMSGDWRFPGEGAESTGAKGKGKGVDGEAKKADGISEPVKEIVRRCLTLEPSERPDVDELIRLIEEVIVALPEDERDA